MGTTTFWSYRLPVNFAPFLCFQMCGDLDPQTPLKYTEATYNYIKVCVLILRLWFLPVLRYAPPILEAPSCSEGLRVVLCVPSRTSALPAPHLEIIYFLLNRTALRLLRWWPFLVLHTTPLALPRHARACLAGSRYELIVCFYFFEIFTFWTIKLIFLLTSQRKKLAICA